MSVTLILIIITAAVSIYAWSNQNLMESWIFHPYTVSKKHQYYRVVTSGFLHADWMHLFFNMFSFYAFGPVIEEVLKGYYGPQIGSLLFLLLYIGGIIISDIYTFIKERNNFNYHGLGASGGVASIIFASVIISPLTKILIFPIPVGIPGFIFAFLYLAYSYYMGKKMADNVNHDAHFFGAVYGVILTFILLPGALGNFISQIQQW